MAVIVVVINNHNLLKFFPNVKVWDFFIIFAHAKDYPRLYKSKYTFR